MINSSRKVNWRMVGFWLALSFAPLAGCLAPDNTPLIQVVPRLVVAPQNLDFKAINYIPFSQPPSGSLQAFWNRSTADTQLNFKGYFVEFWASVINDTTGIDTKITLIDTATILRIGGAVDTTDTFSGYNVGPPRQGIPLGRYTLVLYSGRDTG